MAVSEFPSKNTSFPVEKLTIKDRTTLDHVKRILEDHDYISYMSPDAKKSANISYFGCRVEGATCRFNMQTFDGVSDNSNMKNEHEDQNEGMVPNEGIEASDLSSLLEQFLEYEQAVSTSLLTPATSPGHCETWSEPVLLKGDRRPGTTDLTPPSTPPILEAAEPKTTQKDHTINYPDNHLKLNDKISPAKDVDNISLQRKRKLEQGQISIVENDVSDPKQAKLHIHNELNDIEGLMDDKCSETNENILKEEHTKIDTAYEQLEHNEHKILINGVLKENIKESESNCGESFGNISCKSCNEHESKSQSIVHEIVPSCELKSSVKVQKKQSNELGALVRNKHKKKSKICGDAHSESREYKRRKHVSRRKSFEEDVSSGDERYNPRQCEQSRGGDCESSKFSSNKDRQHGYNTTRSSRKYTRSDHNSSREYSSDKRKQSDTRSRCKKVRDIEHERKIDFRLGRSFIKDSAKEERRVVYVGGLPYGTTRDELWNRLRCFGPVEKVSVHLREGERDNYGFVTFFESEDAQQCIERGNSNPNEPNLDLCFGGRRQYCGGSYVDFDSKTSNIEELSETYGNIRGEIPEEEDFDSLLRQCQKDIGHA